MAHSPGPSSAWAPESEREFCSAPWGVEAGLWLSPGCSSLRGRCPGLFGEHKAERVEDSFHSPVLARAVTTPAVIITTTTTIFILKQGHGQEVLGHTVRRTWLGAGLSPLGGGTLSGNWGG